MLNRLKPLIHPAYLAGAARAALAPKGLRKFRFEGLEIECSPRAFIVQVREIFCWRLYDFDFKDDAPRVLDLGANVGLACLFWRRRFPYALIDAFEPDQALFEVLRRNLRRNGCGDVACHNKAAWIADGTMRFASDTVGGGAGHLDAAGPVEVETVDLKRWLAGRHYDMIKLDVEGAEHSILPHALDEIARAPRLIVEWHSKAAEPQDLGPLLTELTARTYRYHLQSVSEPEAPLRTARMRPIDSQVNLFAWRP